MIRVSVEVCSGGGRLRASVWAENIEQALNLVKSYYPSGEINLVFPIEPGSFFVDGVVSVSEAIRLETPEEAAG